MPTHDPSMDPTESFKNQAYGPFCVLPECEPVKVELKPSVIWYKHSL